MNMGLYFSVKSDIVKEYEYETKRVKIEGKEYDAIFPKKHTRIKAFVREYRDSNAGDSWANISDWVGECYVLWKDDNDEKWECLHNGRGGFYIGKEYIEMKDGIFKVLFELESNKFKKAHLKRREISHLKEQQKRINKRLEELL